MKRRLRLLVIVVAIVIAACVSNMPIDKREIILMRTEYSIEQISIYQSVYDTSQISAYPAPELPYP